MPLRASLPFFRRLDPLLLAPVLTLIAAGLLSLYSATHNAAVFINFQKQVFWVALGLLTMLLVLIAPARFYHYSAWLLYGASLLLLLLVLVFGKTVGGNAGWFGIAGFGIQPSEFAKIATVLALARYVSDSTTNLSLLRDVFTAFLIVFAPWVLILLQPDFGTGLVYWGFFLAMIFWAGAELVLLLVLVSPVLVAALSAVNLWLFLGTAAAVSLLYWVMKRNVGTALLVLALNLSVGFGVQYLYEHLPEYQRARIAVFLDPSRAPQTTGYNVIQSKVAVGSGGMFGRGYLQGSQTQLRFVPEQWTDFIFCVPAEEFGFAGGAGILFLFGVVFVRGIRVARHAQFRFASAMAIGLTSILFIHAVVNIGMTLGLVPVVGIPLPFMSYGGSFFLTSVTAVGLLLHAGAYPGQEDTG